MTGMSAGWRSPSFRRARRDYGHSAELDAKRLAEQRRRVLGELIRAQETERQRIAADIHGDTLQGPVLGFMSGAAK
jgi:signal transduction histidine kinase